MAFKWKFFEHGYAPSYRFKAYPFFASVMDCDGDFISWEVKKHKEILAWGNLSFEECAAHDIENEFALGKEKCEAVLREKITKHLETIDADIAKLRSALAA